MFQTHTWFQRKIKKVLDEVRGRSRRTHRLDAASLDNLRPGDVVIPRRLLEVNGRILGTVGWEEPGLQFHPVRCV